MRAPTGGGASERILDGPYDPATGSHCGIQANSACVLGLLAKDQLVFYSLDPQKGQGKELARTQAGTSGGWLAWALSPDAKRIAVGGLDSLGKNLRIVDLQSGEQREIPSPAKPLGAISWSSDGRAIYGVAQGNVFYLFRADLSGKFQILQESPMGQYFSNPLASPDGRFLAFTRQSGQLNAFLLENF
jgi:Tol biopolymer transport system component